MKLFFLTLVKFACAYDSLKEYEDFVNAQEATILQLDVNNQYIEAEYKIEAGALIDLKVEMLNDPSFKDGVSYNLYQLPEITDSIGSYAEELVGGKWRMHDLR